MSAPLFSQRFPRRAGIGLLALVTLLSGCTGDGGFGGGPDTGAAPPPPKARHMVGPPPGQGMTAPPAGTPQHGVNAPRDLEMELYHLSREVEELKREREAERRATTDMAQNFSLMERDLATMRGELEVLRHQSRRLEESLAAGAGVTSPVPPPGSGYGGAPHTTPPTGTPGTVATVTGQGSAEPVVGPPEHVMPGQPSHNLPSGSAMADHTAGGSPGGAPAGAAAAPSGNPKQVYDAAFLLLKSGQYDRALEGFNNFLRWFPDDALADNAQYWIGEVHYVKRDFPQALVAFNKVLVRWPASDKVPASLLKIGFSFHELEDLENARVSLRRLIKDYPESSAVTMAKQRLRQIDQEAAAPR